MEKNRPGSTRIEHVEMQPYPPSFLDRFLHFIQRLPVPYWLTFLLLFLLESAVNHVLAWIDGWQPAFTMNGLLFLFPLWQWGTLSIVVFLNKTAEGTLSSFRPLMDIDDDRLAKLKYEFTTMPMRGVILSSILWIIVYVVLTQLTFDAFYVRYGIGNFFSVFTFIEGLIAYATGSVIYYHSIRQLLLVNRTVKTARRFNLFNLDPAYAFSHLTSRTGISWMLMLGLTLLMLPLDLANGLLLAILGFQVVLGLAAFILPLRLVNVHLVSEKRRLLAEHHQRVESALARLHRCLDQNDLNEIGQLNNAISGLNAEREILAKIPTWPWSTQTLTGFLTAIVFPIILLLIQIAIQKWFV